MRVILLERIAGVGGIGDEAHVRPGFARNFLLPRGKALRATDANRARVEAERGTILGRNADRRSAAEMRAETLDGAVLAIIRQSGDTGRLYGAVSTRDIAEAAVEAGFDLDRREVRLSRPIKNIGLHEVALALHAEVESSVTVNVARSPDEAERQAAGMDVLAEAAAERKLGGIEVDEETGEVGDEGDEQEELGTERPG